LNFTSFFPLLVLISALFVSCSSRKQTVSEPEESKAQTSVQEIQVPPDFHLLLKRTHCFGPCPVYNLEISADGKMKWEGIYSVPKEGAASKQLSKSEVRKIYEIIVNSEYYTMEPKYDESMISDLPSKIIKLTADGKQKEVVCRHKCPDSFGILFRKLESYIDSSWMEVQND